MDYYQPPILVLERPPRIWFQRENLLNDRRFSIIFSDKNQFDFLKTENSNTVDSFLRKRSLMSNKSTNQNMF